MTVMQQHQEAVLKAAIEYATIEQLKQSINIGEIPSAAGLVWDY